MGASLIVKCEFHILELKSKYTESVCTQCNCNAKRESVNSIDICLYFMHKTHTAMYLHTKLYNTLLSDYT